MNLKQESECIALWSKACEAAQVAAIAQNASLGPEGARGLDCGFAWIVLGPANQPIAQWLKTQDIATKHHQRGYCIWYNHVHNVSTQSVCVHQAATRAAVDVLQRGGVKCYSDSRLD